MQNLKTFYYPSISSLFVHLFVGLTVPVPAFSYTSTQNGSVGRLDIHLSIFQQRATNYGRSCWTTSSNLAGNFGCALSSERHTPTGLLLARHAGRAARRRRRPAPGVGGRLTGGGCGKSHGLLTRVGLTMPIMCQSTFSCASSLKFSIYIMNWHRLCNTPTLLSMLFIVYIYTLYEGKLKKNLM